MNIHVASDLHIGYEHTRYNKLLNFIDIVEAKSDKLILCGDTFDLWRNTFSNMERETKLNSKQCIDRLLELSLEVPVDIIPGNHDYKLSTIWKYNKSLYKYLRIVSPYFSKNIYYTHGWEFDILQRWGSFSYGWLVAKYPYIYQKFFRKPSEVLPLSDMQTGLSLQIHAEAEKFAIANNIRYVVMGHTHIPYCRNNVANCGDFIDSCTYINITEQDNYKCLKLQSI